MRKVGDTGGKGIKWGIGWGTRGVGGDKGGIEQTGDRGHGVRGQGIGDTVSGWVGRQTGDRGHSGGDRGADRA